MGGRETLKSYGVEISDATVNPSLTSELEEKIPSADMTFLGGLETYIETKDLIFVHAGIVPGIPIAEQQEDDLIWIRGEFLNDTRDHGKLIVHGHTPIDAATHYGNRINLDTGAGYFHPLTTAVFEGRYCWNLTASGRVPLYPQPKF